MFTGTYNCKVDSKGRVSFPAPLRRQNPTGGKQTYAVRRSPYATSLVLKTQEAFEQEMEATLQKVNVNTREGDQFRREFCRDLEYLTLDGSDRLLLSKDKLEFLGCVGDLVFVGQLDRIELWEPTRYQAAQLDRAARSEMMDRIESGGLTSDGH